MMLEIRRRVYRFLFAFFGNFLSVYKMKRKMEKISKIVPLGERGSRFWGRCLKTIMNYIDETSDAKRFLSSLSYIGTGKKHFLSFCEKSVFGSCFICFQKQISEKWDGFEREIRKIFEENWKILDVVLRVIWRKFEMIWSKF